MNQLVTNKPNSKTIMRQILRKRKPRLTMRAVFLALCALIFVMPAKAQKVYMHTGSMTVPSSGTINFYDSGGESHGPEYYWERWFQRNEEYTFTFSPAENGKKVKVTFNEFTAYLDNGGYNHAIGNEWSMRLNTAELSVYDGDAVDDANLITTYTGNMTGEFSVIANGPITFYFHSYGYREEGWQATVQCVDNYELQKPQISFEACSDAIVINANNKGAEIYYTTDGNDPDHRDMLANTQLYQGPFNVNAGTTIKAIVKLNGDYSAVATKEFTEDDVTPTPGVPTITREMNTITMTPAAISEEINETYYVWYTTDGSVPTTTNGQRYNAPFEWHTPGTVFTAVTRASSCSDKLSDTVEFHFNNVKVITPTITFSNGNATIACNMPNVTVTIYYTTDGSTPTTSSTPYTGSFAVTYGTTVKAFAVVTQAGFDPSDVASAIYVPEGGSGADGSVVILDDREPHTMSYYTSESPIHSLNPRDIKITYYGNSPAGRTTMTDASESGDAPASFSATASGVAVNIDATESQFIYLKTLEAANENGSGNYPYTMIPNPFQVRPKFEGGGGGGTTPTIDVTIGSGNNTSQYLPTYTYNRYSYSEQIYTASEIGSAGTIRTISFRVSSNATSRAMVIYLKHTSKTSFTSNTDWVSMSSSDQVYSGTVSFTSGWAEITLDTPFEYDGTSNLIVAVDDNTNGWEYNAMQCYTYNAGSNRSIYVTSDNTNYSPSTTTYTGTRGSYCNQIKFSSNGGSSSSAEYRGFYAWRIKSLSAGLTISGKNVDDLVYADEEITFETSKEEGNEVEFEALWAQAYLTTSNSTSGLVSAVGYERNFMVLSNASGTSVSGLTVPCTVTAYNPDGTSGSTTSYISGNITCGADLKIENIRISGNNSTMTAAGHDLIIGRGVTAYSNYCASTIQGINAATNNSLNYTLRIESGDYQDLSCLRGTWDSHTSTTCGSPSVHVNAILGSDYDRAKNNNNDLSIKSEIEFGCQVYLTDIDDTSNTLFFNIKSGDFGREDLEIADYGLYMGISANNDRVGNRYMLIEGGRISNIAGGIDANNPEDGLSFQLRMTGGNVRGAIYGSGAFAAASGNRQMIFTGGKVGGWIAAGCNGTSTTSSGGVLPSDTYIYIGDDTEVGNKDGSTPVHINTSDGGNVFGAGSGNTTFETTGQVNNANVVVADSCYIQNNVFGGGNYGYTSQTANIHVLGGTVGGSVFGGSNQKLGNVTNITMKDGKVTGNIYGGSNITGTVDGLATINVSGGTVTNVYGGGCGAATVMDSGTDVTVSGGTINNNVYGGGELGIVNGTTNVTVSGGTMKNVYGAGKGGDTTADVSGQTFVTVTGGTISQSVYGGGENGDVVAGHTDPTINTEEVTIDFEDNSYTEYLSSTGTYAWQRSTDAPQGGSYCFRSNNYNVNSSESSFSMTYNFEIAQTISFYYKVSSESTYDYLNFYVDGTRINRWSGSVAWTRYTYNISAGSHTLTWTYSKDGSQSSGSDRAWVDNITFSKVTSTTPGEALLASTVSVSGGSIAGDVFGGGRMGKTDGSTEVDIKGGTIRGSVFGGAYGATGSVYVAGVHSVNIMGGRIFSSVYGGSRNANDALAFTGYSTTEKAMSSVVNISAGQVDEQVYAAGYFGQTYGSVYVFVGKNAILNAPHCAPSFGDENENMYKPGKLLLAYNVWAGGDWGTFEGGSFGAPTVSGYSDIYVDGEGYDTETSDESAPSYMNIKGSLLGCGTSCDAGKTGRGIYVRNYGHVNGGSKEGFNEPFSNATRSFFSIQRADTLVIDNSHLNFSGQAKINSLDATEKYAIFSFDKTVRMTSGSSLFLNAPVFQIIDFWSATVDDLYNGINAVYTPIAYNGLGATGGPIDNKIRVNGGNYIEIYHDKMTYENGTIAAGYGMLNGFAHMMVAESNTDNTCAYARPKQCVPTEIDDNLDNPSDGGWVSYNPNENTFSIGTYNNGTWNPVPNTGGTDQIPYENHTTVTKAGEQYFRIWRIGGMYSEREGVINAYADGTESFNFVDVTIKLPAWRSSSAYYKFQTSGTGSNLNTTIDYGPDVMTYATAIVDTTTSGDQNWIHFVENPEAQLTGADTHAQELINKNPNVNFGLVTLAGDGMTLVSPVSNQGGLIVCPESDEFLASLDSTMATVNTFTCSNNTVEPQVTFRLTYSNQISTNMTWDPMFITLVQCDSNGNITDIVKISLTINTYTTINNVFTTQTYAMMDGRHGNADNYTAKVILPTFDLYDYAAEHLSEFTLTSVTFEPNDKDANNDQDCWRPKGSSYDFTHFAMEIAAARNEDNSDGWNGTSTGTYDSHTNLGSGIKLGETGARTPFAFDFTLTYNGNNNGVAFNEDDQHPALLGVLTFTIKFTNYKNGTGTDHSQNLTIKVQVIRRGVGKVFYLDGQNGSNANSALYPNDAALSLSYIFNRCGYMPGDIIYIVNTVDVNKNLEWSGSAYNGVTIYRYPGGHPLTTKPVTDQQGNPLYYTDETQTATTTEETDWPVTYTPLIVDNENNEAFTGTLIAVGNKGNLTIRDITLDGHMSANHVSPYSTDPENPLMDNAVTSGSPMITIASGGTVTLTNGSMLQENNSTVNGGAVAVNDGGTLKMNHDASIMNNVTGGQGGAVYMAGTMIVSDAVQIINNTSGTTPNNVYLTAADKVIQIGTSDASDEFGPLTYTQQTDSHGDLLYWTDGTHTETTTTVTQYPVMFSAQIGVTKTLYGNIDGYTEVVNVETTNEIPWLADPFLRPNTIIFHDGHKYELEEYIDPTYLYWIGTWVTVQDHVPTENEGGWNYPSDITEVTNFDIYTEYQLAWIISLVNGENNQPTNTFEGKTVTIHEDIDMNESIWVPIGTNKTHFKGTFEGNGHVISGIHSILVNDNAAMFGVTEGATIQNVEAVVYFDGNSINKGTFIGTMNGGSLSNVEAAGALIGKTNTINMGGLVGLAIGTGTNKPIIHSGFSVNTITAEKATTVVGGLVGSLGDVVTDENNVTTKYYADLYNSYANVTYTGTPTNIMGGLVGINHEDCTVENCYVVSPINPSAVFAYTNDGTVDYCYAVNGTNATALFANGTHTSTPVGYGTYDDVIGRKELGYMYYDNVVEAQTGDTTYIRSKIIHNDYQIIEWPGLLSTLNQWVKEKNTTQDDPLYGKDFAPWFRPTSGDINDDLPLLGFHKDNSLSTFVYDLFNEPYNYLHYGAFDDTNNGLDNLLTLNAGKSAYMFLYGYATNVVGETGSNKLFINEDAVLIQKATDNGYSEINATVGITFDNTGKYAKDYWGNDLDYDWHLMSTPLANAPLGITYADLTTDYNYWDYPDTDKGQAVNVFNSYMPNMSRSNMNTDWAHSWDFYTYYEPKYHWINFKRNINSHHHYEEPHDNIPYVGMEQTAEEVQGNLIPGRGYMMAIDQDSYLSSTGMLNKGNVKIALTISGDQNNDPAPTKDWGSNLVGNPYQAYLNLAKLADDNGFTGEIVDDNYSCNGFYIYDADRGTYGPYITNASANPVIPSQFIHPHQAFFVVITGDPDTLMFTPDMATATPNDESYFRGEEQPRYPVVNLFAENEAGNRDLAVIELNRPALGGVRKVDNLRNANFKISANLGGHGYGLMFTPEGTERVPVHFQPTEDGVYTLTWSMYNGDFTSLRLIDNKTGVNYDMLTNNSYTFESSVDDYTSRFYITYSVIGVDENVTDGDNSFAFFNGSEWVINGKGQLDVIDVTGRVIYAAQLNNEQNRVHLDGVAKGVYLLRVIDNKVMRTQKIIVR